MTCEMRSVSHMSTPSTTPSRPHMDGWMHVIFLHVSHTQLYVQLQTSTHINELHIIKHICNNYLLNTFSFFLLMRSFT